MNDAMTSGVASRRRAQFSLEAMVLLAAYFMFVALLVSAVGGQERAQVLALKGEAIAGNARPVYALYGVVASNATPSCALSPNSGCISSGAGAVLGWR